MSEATLQHAPNRLTDDQGEPRWGSYQGGLDAVDLASLSARHQPSTLNRLLKHKRWLYSFIATRECIVLYSMADLSYTSNGFVLVADLVQRRLVVDRGFLGLPGPLVHVSDEPGAGLRAHFRTVGADFSASRPRGDDRYHLSARLGVKLPFKKPALQLDASLLAAGASPPLTVIAPVEGGVVNVTQKWAGLLSFGSLECNGKRYLLDGGVGGLDYTHGYLARRTSWRWGFACGRLEDGAPLGLNLVEGFNEGRTDVNENALWLNGKLYPLGRAHFEWNKADPLQPWRVETDDGAVKLNFHPIGAHREERNLQVVKSHFVQPVGLFEGVVKLEGVEHRVAGVPGVTEDQDILW